MNRDDKVRDGRFLDTPEKRGGGFGLYSIFGSDRYHCHHLYHPYRRSERGVNINWRHCRGEEIEAQLPWENDTFPDFDDRESLGTFLVVIIYLATPLEEDQPLVTPHHSPSSVREAYLEKSSEITS